MFLSACFGQLIVSSCGGMMGTLHSEATRRKASSFLPGRLARLRSSGHLRPGPLAEKICMGPLGWIAAALIALPAFAASPPQNRRVKQEQGIKQTFACIWHEFKATFFCWRAVPYTLLMLFPMGSAEPLIGLLPGIAQDYGRQLASRWLG